MRNVLALLFAFATIASAQTTYTRDVARILQVKCQQCHRPNDVAPFALMTYDDAATYAADIKTAVTNKTMPPWKPVPGYNNFSDSFALTDDERNTILAWIDGGAPQGDMADMPAALPVSESPWHLGQPDMVLTMPEYTPPPRATDTYRCFVLPTGLTDNRFIAASQALPGNAQITHHVLLFLDEVGEAEKFDGQDGQPGYDCFGGPNLTSIVSADLTAVLTGRVSVLHGTLLGGWAPGTRTRRLAEDIGVPIPKGSRVVMQVHYHPAGRAGSDKTQLGLWFADTAKIKHRLLNVPVANTRFQIPAGDANYQPEPGTLRLPLSFKVITVAPHMHLLGKQIKVEVTDTFTGTKRPLIYIDDWDFNWQGFYVLAEPMSVPALATVSVTAVYDNSSNNRKNPNNPVVPVGWGERTTDEMLLAFIGVIFDNEAFLPLPFSAGNK